MPPMMRELGTLAVSVIRSSCPLRRSGTVAGSIGLAQARPFSTVSSEQAQASTSGQDVPPGWLGRELKPKAKKDPPLSWLYMREGPDGVKRLMGWSERLIWGTVIGGLAYFIVPRVYNSRKKAAEEREAEKVRQEELRQKRLVAARLLLSGKTWLHDESEPFEGMTPKQIVEFLKEHSINPEDPFEGMSPEEIDEFVQKTGVSI